MRVPHVALALAACGRVGFADHGSADSRLDATRGAMDDAALVDANPNLVGLVGWWRFDDGSGTIATDSSGQGNTGHLENNPTWTTGEVGGALAFGGDSTNQYVDVADAPSLELASSWTVATWADLAVLPVGSAYDSMVVKSTAGGYANYNLSVNNGGWEISYNGVCGLGDVVSGPPVVGVWTHVAGVFDAAEQTLAIYIDGALAMSNIETDCLPTQTGSGEDLTIATEYGGGVTMFDGSLDDVRVYDRALSAEEIASIFSKP